MSAGERTLHRWLRARAFSAACGRARREQFALAVSPAQRHAPASHSARVAAHVAVLKLARESIELDEPVGRIEALETATMQRDTEDWVSQ